MILTIKEYIGLYKFVGKTISMSTMRRRCEKSYLPTNHKARKLPGKTGAWVIEVTEGVINENIVRFYNINITKK